jgi:hypothetical protein
MWDCSVASRKLRARRRKSDEVMENSLEIQANQNTAGREKKGLDSGLDVLYVLYRQKLVKEPT